MPELINSLIGSQWQRLHSAASGYIRRLDPSLRHRILRGAIWSVAGAGLASGLTMIGNIVCARLLGPSRFGELAIVLATTNLFTSLFTSGVSMTASRFVAQYRDADPQRAGTVIGLSSATSIAVGGIVALAVLLAAPWMSREILGAPGLSTALGLGAVAMFLASLNGSQVGALSGLESFNRVAFGNLVRGVGLILFVTAGAVLGGINGALLGYIAAGAATAIYCQIALRAECAARSIPISYRFVRDDWRILLQFTLPVLLTTFSFTPAAWWSNILLVNRNGYAEAGVFNAIFQWQMLIVFFSTALSNIGLPMLSNIRAECDPAKYKRCLAINFLLTSAPAIAIAAPVALFSGLIVRLYGPAFQHGARALALISLAAVFSAINLPVGHVIWSLDATLPAVLLALVRGGSLVLAAYALAGNGAAGLAGAYVIMGIAQTIATVPFMIWVLRRKLHSSAAEAEPVLAV